MLHIKTDEIYGKNPVTNSNDLRTHFELESPSGYKFRSLYIVKYIERQNGSRRNISGSFYIGHPKTRNPMEACTTITVQYPESVLEFEEKYQRPSLKRPSLIDPTIASLVLTKYSPACAENRPLLGEGTIDMITSAMSLVKQVCPFIKEFDLNDASSKQCDNGSSISLPYFYLTNHHKTWYEAKFNARLKPDNLMESYQHTLQTLLQSPLEPFDVFQARFLSRVNHVLKDAIRQSYEKAETVGTFFKQLYDQHGTKMVCMLLQGWIDEYMRLMKMEPFVKHHKWFISAESIPIQRFRNERNIHRSTRKRNNGVRRRTLWNENNQKGSGRRR
jgi:hypothetical protein